MKYFNPAVACDISRDCDQDKPNLRSLLEACGDSSTLNMTFVLIYSVFFLFFFFRGGGGGGGGGGGAVGGDFQLKGERFLHYFFQIQQSNFCYASTFAQWLLDDMVLRYINTQ